MDKLEEMDKFLERYNLPRLTQEEIENMNRPIRSTKIATVILKLQKKSPGPDDLTGKFYQTFREELTPILLKLSKKKKKITEERTVSNSVYETNITLIPKPDQVTTRKDN